MRGSNNSGDGCLEMIGGAFGIAGILTGTGMSLIGDMPHAGRFVGSGLAVVGLLLALGPYLLAEEDPWTKLMVFGAILFLGSVPLFFTLQGLSVPNGLVWILAPLVLALGIALLILGSNMAVRQDRRARANRQARRP